MQHGPSSHLTSQGVFSIDPMLFAGTLCAKLCHDLAGTLGALTGTLEMAVESNDAEALALARDCARELSARLRLLRAAWGSDSEMPDLASLASGLPGAERLQVDCSALAADLAPLASRLAACLMMLAAQSLPRGGVIHLSGNAVEIMVEIGGPRAAWPASFRQQLEDPSVMAESAANIREIASLMACLQAERAGMRLSLGEDDVLLAKCI